MFEFTVSPLEAEMAVRSIVAAIFGLLIGMERRGGHTGAGMRTFSLICMGSALFTVLSAQGFGPGTDPSRLAAQIVTGIGFIGAGVIWRQREEAIHGITTAAAIWVSAAVGIAVGLGYYVLSSSLTVVVMLLLSRGHPLKGAKESLQCELQT